MIFSRLQQYHLAIVSFCFGIMVIASIGAAGFLTVVSAEESKSTAKFAGCGTTAFDCKSAPGTIIPQCKVVEKGTEKVIKVADPLQCCNYTLDAFIQLAINIATYILGISGSVALLIVVLGGFQYLTSAGDKAKVKAGTTTMINAVIGLLIIFSSWMIVNFVMDSLIARDQADNTLANRLRGVFNGSSEWSYKAAICTPIKFGTLGEVASLPARLDAHLAQVQEENKVLCGVSLSDARTKAEAKCGADPALSTIYPQGNNTYCYACKNLTCTGTDNFLTNETQLGGGRCETYAKTLPVKSRIVVAEYLVGGKLCCVLPIKAPGTACAKPPALAYCAATEYPDDPLGSNCMCRIKKELREDCSDDRECKTNRCVSGECSS